LPSKATPLTKNPSPFGEGRIMQHPLPLQVAKGVGEGRRRVSGKFAFGVKGVATVPF